MEIARWDVLLVNLDPTVGKEIKKIRPAVVVSPDEINHYWSPIVIVPMTTRIRNLGFRVPIAFDGTKGQAAIDQIKAIDTHRIVKKLGSLSKKDQQAVLENLQLFFNE